MIARFPCPTCKTNLMVDIKDKNEPSFVWTLSEMKLILRLRQQEDPTIVAVQVEKGQPRFVMVFGTKMEVLGGDRTKIS